MRNILKILFVIILWLSISMVAYAKPNEYDCYYLHSMIINKNNFHENNYNKFPPPITIHTYNDLIHKNEKTSEVYIQKMIEVFDEIFDKNKDWNSNISNRSQYFLVKGILLCKLKNKDSVKYLKKYLYLSYKVEKLFNEKRINLIPEPMIAYRNTAFVRLMETTHKKITANDIINDIDLVSDKDLNISLSQLK
jgi:hypothetical protein